MAEGFAPILDAVSGIGSSPSQRELNWKYVNDVITEDAALAAARHRSSEFGIEPVSPAVGAQLAVMTAAVGARSIIELGTGVGVSGLYLLRGAPHATLTTIDTEPVVQRAARECFTEGGIPAAQARTITGRSEDLLERMNEKSYDVVFIDADPAQIIGDVEHGLRLVRDGGVVLVAHALWHGRVADPARRDPVESAFRDLYAELLVSTAVRCAINPAGDGLLHIVTQRATPVLD